MEILTMNDVIKRYGINRKYATKLLNTKGCPVLPRKKNQVYRVVGAEFEKWMNDLRK